MRGWLSGITFGVGLTVLIGSCIPNLLSESVRDSFLVEVFQFLGSVLTSIGAIFLLKKWTDAKFPDTSSLSSVVAVILIILILLSYLVLRYKPDLQIALSILASMTVVSMGWWVQSVIAAKTARRQHTLNTILNTRSSEIYQRHLENYSKLIKDDRYLHPKIAQWFHRMNSAEFEVMAIPENLRDAVNGLNYVINYFEFLALAIEQGDLDEALLKDCFCGMLPKIESRGFHLIHEAQTKNDKFFCAFVSMVERWSDQNQSLILKYKSKPKDATLGEPFPSEDQVKAMLKGEFVELGYKCASAESRTAKVHPPKKQL